MKETNQGSSTPPPARPRRQVIDAFRQAFELRHFVALAVTWSLPLLGHWWRGYEGDKLTPGHCLSGLSLTFGVALVTCIMWAWMTPGRFQESHERDGTPRHRWRRRWWGAFFAAFCVMTLANGSLWYGVHDLFLKPEHGEAWHWTWRIVLHLVHGILCTLAGVSLVFQTWNTKRLPELITFEEVRKAERVDRGTRRARAGLEEWGDKRSFGLALSGGGIRSATTSLGVLEALSTRNLAGRDVEALRAFDYLSSVSGGGWAAGAVTAAYASGKPPKLFIPTIVARFRRASDYVIPGGVGLTRATLRPAILLLVGIAVNVVVLIPFTVFAVLILSNMSSNGWLMTSLHAARRHLPEFDLFWSVGRGHGLFHQISALQVVSLVTYLGFAAIVLGLGMLLLSMLLAPFSRFSSWLRRSGQTGAEFGLLVALLGGGLVLFLAGSNVLTAIALSALSAALVIRVIPRIDRSQRMKVIGATFASQSAVLLTWDPYHILQTITNIWVRPIHGLLAWPLTWTTPGVTQYSERLFYSELALGVAFLLGFFVSRNDISLHGFWTDRIRRAFLPPLRPRPVEFGIDSLHRRLRSRSGATTKSEGAPSPNDGPDPDVDEVVGVVGSLTDAPLARLRPPTPELAAIPLDAYRLEPFETARAANTGGSGLGAPIHIINAAVNLPGSADSRLRKRGTARFEFSPYYVGCRETGWTMTNRYGDSITLANALAISAAAVNSQAGYLIGRGLRVAVAAGNLSLGVWVRNPRLGRIGKEVGAEQEWLDARFRRWGHFWVAYQVSDLVGRNNETDPLLFVSDGGHHDNLGLSALIERRCEYIVCVDAGADPTYGCEDLAQVLRMMEIDDNWKFTFNISGGDCSFKAACAALRAGQGPLTIHATHSQHPEALTILYCKAALPDGAPIAVEHYAASHPDFPHESTADQFFDEAQFEAYLQLGRRMGTDIVDFLDRAHHSAG